MFMSYGGSGAGQQNGRQPTRRDAFTFWLVSVLIGADIRRILVLLLVLVVAGVLLAYQLGVFST